MTERTTRIMKTITPMTIPAMAPADNVVWIELIGDIIRNANGTGRHKTPWQLEAAGEVFCT